MRCCCSIMGYCYLMLQPRKWQCLNMIINIYNQSLHCASQSTRARKLVYGSGPADGIDQAGILKNKIQCGRTTGAKNPRRKSAASLLGVFRRTWFGLSAPPVRWNPQARENSATHSLRPPLVAAQLGQMIPRKNHQHTAASCTWKMLCVLSFFQPQNSSRCESITAYGCVRKWGIKPGIIPVLIINLKGISRETNHWFGVFSP